MKKKKVYLKRYYRNVVIRCMLFPPEVMSSPYVLYGEIRHTNYMAMGGQLNLIWVSSCSLYGEGTSHFIMYLVW